MRTTAIQEGLPKPSKRELKERAQANAAFLKNIEAFFQVAPDGEIEKYLKPQNLVPLYRKFGYAPGAWMEGTSRMKAELQRRACLRDGLKVCRIGGHVQAVEAVPRKRARSGKLHEYNGREKGMIQSLILGITGGKKPKGTPRLPDKQVVEKLKEKIAAHSILKEFPLAGQRTFERWVATVRAGGDIPGATFGRDI